MSEDPTSRSKINIDLHKSKQKRDLQTFLAKIHVDHQFLFEVMVNPQQCLRKHNLNLPQGLVELITQRRVGQRQGRDSGKGSRIASFIRKKILFKKKQSIVRKIQYEGPLIFSVEFCTEIYNKMMVNLDVFLALSSQEDVFLTYSYDPEMLIPIEVTLPQFLEKQPRLKYDEYWINDHHMVIHPFSRVLYRLNDVGAWISRACTGRQSVSEIAVSLQSKYDNEPQRIQDDLVEFMCLLADIDLVEL